MKRSVISQFDQLKGRFESYVAMMYYRYANLCIKAEELSLLPILVVIEDETKRLEEVANVAKEGEYAFKIFPNYDEDLMAVGKAIALSHPEFKQERKTLNVEMDDGERVEVAYILLTMPEVKDERYDVLKQGTNAFYEECKMQMETAKAEADAQMAVLMVGEKEEEIEKAKDGVKEMEKMWTEKRDQIHEEKLKEIEEAHEKYLSEKGQQHLNTGADQQNDGKSFDMRNMTEE